MLCLEKYSVFGTRSTFLVLDIFTHKYGKIDVKIRLIIYKEKLELLGVEQKNELSELGKNH